MRDFGLVLAAFTVLAVNAPRGTAADYPLTRITDKVYIINGPLDLPTRDNRGFRNNPGIVLTSAGVAIFDPGGSAWSGEMVVARVRSISDKPIVAVFNSHAHGDHWLGNEGIKRHFPAAVIYAHPVMKKKAEGADGARWFEIMAQMTEGTDGGRRHVPPDSPVNDGNTIELGDTRFRIYHTGPAHTDNDIMVEVIGESVLFTGDIVRNGMIGTMRDDSSFKGNLEAIDLLLGRQLDHYIPGHGQSGGNDMVASYRMFLHTVLSLVTQLYEQDLEDFEMKPNVVEALSAYHEWANFDDLIGMNISRAYLEVEASVFE